MDKNNEYQDNAKNVGSNTLFDVINKFTDEEKKHLAGITLQAVRPLLADQRIPQDSINRAKDVIYLSVCSAYIYGNRRVIEELDKL